MKRFFLLIFLAFSLIYQAQTAEQIIAKHLEITGGTHGWKALQSLVIKGNTVLGINEEYPTEIYQQRPNHTKTLMTSQGKKITLSGYNGKRAVQFNFQTGKLNTNPDYVPESFESDLLDFIDKGFQAVLMENEIINGTDCFKIQLSKNQNVTTYYFDVETCQLVREVNSERNTYYSDFKEVSGLIFPFRIEEKSADGKEDFTLIINSIEANPAIPAKVFDF